ncbi:MAG: hypothetical protein K2H12_06215 [Acetatifactor sp.]|nr:hypothetical protein [Acetatifactor sp.]
MAIGGIWEKDSLNGVEGLIAEAEERMYRDKAAYYKQYGVDRRRSSERGALFGRRTPAN